MCRDSLTWHQGSVLQKNCNLLNKEYLQWKLKNDSCRFADLHILKRNLYNIYNIYNIQAKFNLLSEQDFFLNNTGDKNSWKCWNLELFNLSIAIIIFRKKKIQRHVIQSTLDPNAIWPPVDIWSSNKKIILFQSINSWRGFKNMKWANLQKLNFPSSNWEVCWRIIK